MLFDVALLKTKIFFFFFRHREYFWFFCCYHQIKPIKGDEVFWKEKKPRWLLVQRVINQQKEKLLK